MATGIVDYASLKTEIGNWSARTDLTTEYDTMIQLCENQLNRELRTRQMDINISIPTTSNVVPLPADILQIRNVELSGTPVIPLRFVTPEQKDLYDLQASVGTPRIYSIIGGSLILAPTPDKIYSCNFEYYQRLPTLVNGLNTTNWLLNLHPDVYLFGCLAASGAYVRDDQRLAGWSAMFEKLKSDLSRVDDDMAYSGSVIRMRSDSGT